ncbi:MAG: SGNH/GDSL hydrolase family protein [Candidatus Methylacidiphilales bacterium]
MSVYNGIKFFQIICLAAVLSACSKQTTTISQPIVPNTPKSDTFKVNYLALGDSYTIGQGVAFEENFPNQLAKALANDTILFNEVKIIATTGWTTTNLIDAINNQNSDKKHNLVSLLIGVNNQYQNKPIELYKTEFKTLLNKAIALSNFDTSNIFVVSIPDYGFTPFGCSNQKTISDEISNYNRINKEITDSFNISYINITPISQMGLTKPELVAADGLHPSGAMYKLWVELMSNEIYKKLN